MLRSYRSRFFKCNSLIILAFLCSTLPTGSFVDSFSFPYIAPTTVGRNTRACHKRHPWKKARPKHSQPLLFMGSTTATSATVDLARAKPRTGISHWLLNRLLESPLWKLVLVPQAKHVMTKTAEANGIPWKKALEWIEIYGGPWREENASTSSSYPEYFLRSFHAYEKGNLCWEAAFEQEIASRAVGVRNFPSDKSRGEDAFRDAFDISLSSLGAKVPTQGVIVDLGCGTGASTRRLASKWDAAKNIIGIDLSPYFIQVGRKLLELQPKSFEEGGSWVTTICSDSRIEFRVGDIAQHTGLPDDFADAINLQFVLHELPLSAAKAAVDEALRMLKPGGQMWICEMDFDSPAYAEQRANALLFSLLRATEPYLDEYADGMAELHQIIAQKFASTKIKAATGRHYSLVATKSKNNRASERQTPAVIDDLRFNADGMYDVVDTHLKPWESEK